MHHTDLDFYVSNNNIDIKFSAHDAFLEWPSSLTLKVKRLENKQITNLWRH
jgi:hypothetical protein